MSGLCPQDLLRHALVEILSHDDLVLGLLHGHEYDEGKVVQERLNAAVRCLVSSPLIHVLGHLAITDQTAVSSEVAFRYHTAVQAPVAAAGAEIP